MWTCAVNVDVGVCVVLLGSTHYYSIDFPIVESPFRIQGTVEEEHPKLSSHLPPAPLSLHL